MNILYSDNSFENLNKKSSIDGFISNLEKIDLEDPNRKLDILNEFIISGFVELLESEFPNTGRGLRESIDRVGITHTTKLLTNPQVGDLGIEYLAGVTHVLSVGQTAETLGNRQTLSLIKDMHDQHILEVITDNLQPLLSKDNTVGLFNIFLAVLDDDLTLKEAYDIITEELHKYLPPQMILNNDRFKSFMMYLNHYGINLDLNIPESDGKTFADNLLTNLIYLNLKASKKAFDNLKRYEESPDSTISYLANFAKKSLRERYSAQIDIITHGGLENLTMQELLTLREQDILTNYTYPTFMLAIATSNPQIKQELDTLVNISNSNSNLLATLIKKAGLYIRIVNDIGAFTHIKTSEIQPSLGKLFILLDTVANFISYKNTESNYEVILKNSIGNLFDVYNWLFDTTISNPFTKDLLVANQDIANTYAMLVGENLSLFEQISPEQLFFTIIKDLEQDEDNMAIASGTNSLSYQDYLGRIYDRIAGLIIAANNVLSILRNKEVGIPDRVGQLTYSFMKYCDELYANRIDFDSATAEDAQMKATGRIKTIRELSVVKNPKLAWIQLRRN